MNRKSKKINAFTLAGGRSPLLNGDEGAQGSPSLAKVAFTLAEVLITLGVIGVVAAVTLPTLIQNYKKHVVETRLAKFYTTINQAIQMSETVNGDKKYWDTLGSGFEKDENDNPDYSKPEAIAWFDKYLKPYLKYAKLETFNHKNTQGLVMVYFEDGSLLAFSAAGWSFYPYANKFKSFVDENDIIQMDGSNSGTEYFSFFYAPNTFGENYKYHYNKDVEPYMYHWDGTIDGTNGLKTSQSFGCKKDVPRSGRAYCTALIMQNGWKIPKDYPIKF